MAEENKALVKSSIALARFDPKARNELVVRGLIALADVRDADFYFFKGEEHRIKGELRQALDNYEKALLIDPKHVDSLDWMGYCCLFDVIKPQNQRAAEALQKLINIREKEGNLSWYDYPRYFNLGAAQYGLGLYEEAIKSCGRAIELNPEHSISYLGLGNAQYGLGLYEEAKENCERAIELNHEDPGAYYTLGLMQEKKGLEHKHLAIGYFEKYLSLDGDKSPECVEYAKHRVKLLKGITKP